MPAGLRCDHYDMIDLATRGGATVLGLPGTGELAAGKAADVITIDLGAPHLNGYGDPALSAFLGAGPRDVSTVIADGHLLKDRGRLHPGLLEHGTDRLRSSRARITARAASGDR
jgi:cytosine/adenosine deaminase-related metal-dependent hydrolase